MGYESQPLAAFLADVASTDVAPAGGTAGAVVGAIGTACVEMVCIHLRAADVATDADLAARRGDLERCRGRLLELAEADADVVEALFAAADDGGDPATVKRAVGVPLSVAETSADALESATVVAGAADRPVVADAGAGAYFLRAALEAAVFTVRRNLETVEDDTFRGESARRASELETAGDRAFDAVMTSLDGDA